MVVTVGVTMSLTSGLTPACDVTVVSVCHGVKTLLRQTHWGQGHSMARRSHANQSNVVTMATEVELRVHEDLTDCGVELRGVSSGGHVVPQPHLPVGRSLGAEHRMIAVSAPCRCRAKTTTSSFMTA